MIVSARPYPDIETLYSSSGYCNFIFDEFYNLGRDALLSSLIALGIQRGDSIIIPAYICDTTLKPLKTYGFNLVFVDIEKDLSLSVHNIKKVIVDNQVRALLLVHYFGMTQNIVEITGSCRELGVKVVEDASHSFMSQFLRDKGVVKGDVEIFSMRKSLPVLDGGALRFNNDNYKSVKVCRSQCSSITSDIKYLVLRSFEKLVTTMGINIYSQFINDTKIKLRSNKANTTNNLNSESCQASWQLKKYLGDEKYLKNSQHRVVNNFNTLSKELRRIGFRLFADTVVDNVIPQACIIYDDKGGLVDYLRRSGIGAWSWPGEEIPVEVLNNLDNYPNSGYLNKNLVLLPIHQSINKNNRDHMINVLFKWKSLDKK